MFPRSNRTQPPAQRQTNDNLVPLSGIVVFVFSASVFPRTDCSIIHGCWATSSSAPVSIEGATNELALPRILPSPRTWFAPPYSTSSNCPRHALGSAGVWQVVSGLSLSRAGNSQSSRKASTPSPLLRAKTERRPMEAGASWRPADCCFADLSSRGIVAPYMCLCLLEEM